MPFNPISHQKLNFESYYVPVFDCRVVWGCPGQRDNLAKIELLLDLRDLVCVVIHEGPGVIHEALLEASGWRARKRGAEAGANLTRCCLEFAIQLIVAGHIFLSRSYCTRPESEPPTNVWGLVSLVPGATTQTLPTAHGMGPICRVTVLTLRRVHPPKFSHDVTPTFSRSILGVRKYYESAL